MSDLPPADNPATRLHSLLTDLVKRPASQPLGEAWAEVLNVPKDDTSQLFEELSAVHYLHTHALALLEDHPDASDGPHFTTWSAPVLTALGQSRNLSNTAQHAQQYLTEAVLLSLSAAGWLLGRDGHRMPTDQHVGDLITMLNQFEERILQEDVEDDLRLFLLAHLAAMRTAIRLVQIQGVDALRDAAEKGMGAAVYWLTTTGTKPPLIERMWEVAHKIATVAQITTTGVMIVSTTVPALPG